MCCGNNPSPLEKVKVITLAALRTKVSTSKLRPGQWYQISDFSTPGQGRFGTVYVQAVSKTQLAVDNAYWYFTTVLTSFGWIDLAGAMVAGDLLSSIAVNGVNQLSASVGMPTDFDYSALAILAAANINANGSASVTATAYNERVYLHWKTTGTTANGHSVAGTGTNFTASGSSNLSLGQADSNLFLQCSYNLTENHIYRVIQPFYDIQYWLTDAALDTLGYNPIYYFRWGQLDSSVSPFAGAWIKSLSYRYWDKIPYSGLLM